MNFYNLPRSILYDERYYSVDIAIIVHKLNSQVVKNNILFQRLNFFSLGEFPFIHTWRLTFLSASINTFLRRIHIQWRFRAVGQVLQPTMKLKLYVREQEVTCKLYYVLRLLLKWVLLDDLYTIILFLTHLTIISQFKRLP